jgi:ribonuclease VapC
MILDSSAVVAIALNEPERASLLKAIVDSSTVSVSAATWFELSMVLAASKHPDAEAFLAWFRGGLRVSTVPFTAEHATAALDAWRAYGKGNHPARLNFGDCISYATAKLADEPLLFVGDDFAHTDVVPGLGHFNG